MEPKVVMITKVRRGGALTDWIPGYKAASDAVQNAYNAYNVYKDITTPIPEQPTPITSTQSQGDFSFLEDGPNFDQGVKFEPIPEPPPAPPVYTWKPAVFRKPTKQLDPEQSNYKNRNMDFGDHTIIQKVKRVKPISFIDNTLKSLGVRDKVRGYLNKSELGRLAVKGADKAMQWGFGDHVPDPELIQSIIIKRVGKFQELSKATKWVKERYNPKKVDITNNNTFRFRLKHPKKGMRFRTLQDPDEPNVKYVIEYKLKGGVLPPPLIHE